jgi:hypothetical protein
MLHNILLNSPNILGSKEKMTQYLVPGVDKAKLDGSHGITFPVKLSLRSQGAMSPKAGILFTYRDDVEIARCRKKEAKKAQRIKPTSSSKK